MEDTFELNCIIKFMYFVWVIPSYLLFYSSVVVNGLSVRLIPFNYPLMDNNSREWQAVQVQDSDRCTLVHIYIHMVVGEHTLSTNRNLTVVNLSVFLEHQQF